MQPGASTPGTKFSLPILTQLPFLKPIWEEKLVTAVKEARTSSRAGTGSAAINTANNGSTPFAERLPK